MLAQVTDSNLCHSNVKQYKLIVKYLCDRKILLSLRMINLGLDNIQFYDHLDASFATDPYQKAQLRYIVNASVLRYVSYKIRHTAK